MTSRPAQRWRVEEAQQSTNTVNASTMNASSTDVVAAADGSELLHNPLSPPSYTAPRSPALASVPPPFPPPPPPFPAFSLTPLLRRITTTLTSLSHPSRPFVTLTFAQSLDASLSYSPTPSNPPLILSSPASLRLTHYLRAIHSAILIGANTLQCDNPSLTCRLIPDGRSPTPIIVEGSGAEVSDTDNKKAIRDGTWIVMNDRGVRSDRVGRVWSRDEWDSGGEGETTKEKRITRLLERGCRILILHCSAPSSSHISFPTLLAYLQPYFHSVMVEGGAGVITSLLQSDECVIDQVVLTVAPLFVGGWRSVQSRIGESGLRLCEMACEMCGDDVILHAFTSPPPPTLLSVAAVIDASSASDSLITVLSNVYSFVNRTLIRLRRYLIPLLSHVAEPYNAVVYAAVALPPLVVLCNTLLRLHALRRLLPASAVERLDRLTRWRVSLLLPALLLLAHHLMQQWRGTDRSDWTHAHERQQRTAHQRHKRGTNEQEMRVLSSSPHSSVATTLTPLLSAPVPVPQSVSLPAQSYLLPFTSAPAAISRPATHHPSQSQLPIPASILYSSPSHAAVQQPSTASKASAVLASIKHNRRQSHSQQSDSGSGSGSVGNSGVGTKKQHAGEKVRRVGGSSEDAIRPSSASECEEAKVRER